MVEAAKAVGCSMDSISKAVRRSGSYYHGMCKGFLWDYAEKE
jgi:hypothetical protein